MSVGRCDGPAQAVIVAAVTKLAGQEHAGRFQAIALLRFVLQHLKRRGSARRREQAVEFGKR
jgi:hypothetical protein